MKSNSGLFRLVSTARHRGRHDPPRILVAEDDPEMLRVVIDALTDDAYDVRTMPDGGRVLVNVGRYWQGDSDADVDLMIMDIRMPVCDGMQLLRTMRQLGWTVPVILMTAFGDEDTRLEAEQLGAILFDKPFSLDDLRTAVMNLMAP